MWIFVKLILNLGKKDSIRNTRIRQSFPRQNFNITTFLVKIQREPNLSFGLLRAVHQVSQNICYKKSLLTNISFLIPCMIHPERGFVICNLTYYHFQCLVHCYELLKSTVSWVWICNVTYHHSEYLVHFIGIVVSGRSSHKLFYNTYHRYHNWVCHKASTLREERAVINLNE